MPLKPPIHDGEGDAMPCACPACRSPFIVHSSRLAGGPQEAIERDAVNTDGASIARAGKLREARAC